MALRKATGYQQEMKRTFMIPLSAAAIMGVITFIINLIVGAFAPKSVATIISVLIAMAVYGVSLLKLGALTPNEIIALPKGSKLLGILQKVHLVEK